MGLRKIDKCGKGDIEMSSFKPEIPEFEILVERSLPNKDGVTIRLWKKEDNKFQVGLIRDGKDTKIIPYKEYEVEALPWGLYEGCCDVYGCLPYPEAEAYYRRRGRLKPSPEEHAE